jgi:hypothetical protein
MIIEADVTTVVTNMPVGTTTEMVISKEGMAHLMKTLSNMYNDPKLAVIREYFTNGLDSHVMAGQTAPVEVSLPNSYNNMYVVQDFGVGMSVDDIKNVYSQYGASTKRDSNDQIGAFGLGAKSALAIANQFTLVTIKDGVKATVLVQKSASGINTMSIVSVLDTEDANGVTVSIPIEDPYSFNQKAREFFRFVDPGMVLVDGYAPTSIFSSATKLEDITIPGVEAYVNLENNYGTSYVIMGQVAYALTTENIEESTERLGILSTYQLRSMPVYFKVAIGDVDLTPNREGLLFNDKTNTLIDTLISEYMESVKQAAQTAVDAIENRHDVYQLAQEWTERLGMDMTWRGEEILSEIKTASPSSTIKRTAWDKTSHGSTYALRLNHTDQRVIVTGQPFDKYKRMSNYITDYMEMMNLRSAIFYFRAELDEMDNVWATEHPSFIFEDFDDMIQRVRDHRKAVRAAQKALLPKEQRDRPAKMEYAVLDLDEGKISRIAYDVLPTDAYYLHAAQMDSPGTYRDAFDGKSYGARDLLENLRNLLGDGASVIFIPKTRSLESFLARTKDITGLRSLTEIGPDVQARIDALMTPEVLWHRNRDLNHMANRRVARLPQEKIDSILDEDFRALVSHSSTETVAANNDALRLWRYLNQLSLTGVTASIPTTVTPEEPDNGTTYPLLDALSYGELSGAQQDHLVQYINMVYTDQLTLVDA